MNVLSRRRRVIILISCCLSLLIASMDATIVNVAIPSIRTELGASASQLEWVIDIYTLVLASLLLLSGATADRFGRRRVFQTGLMVFAAGSLLCSVAPNIHALIAARLVQAIGGSMLNPVAMSIITQVFTGEMGWTSALALAIAALAGIAFATFLWYESRRNDPFIDLRFFRSVPFASATLIAVCAFAVYGAFLFMMSLYLQGGRHYSAAHTGLLYLPIAGSSLIFSPLSGRLVGRFGARPSLLVAGIMITTSTLLLTRLTATTHVVALIGIFAVFGIGFAMVNAPITTAAVSGMPTDRAGAASAVASTSRQVGVSIGVALCGSLAGGALSVAGIDFAAASRPLWFVAAALGVVITALAIVSTSRPAIRSAERLAPLVAGSDQLEGSARAA